MASRAFLIPLALVCLALVAPSAQAGIDITVTGPDRAPEVTPGGSSSATVEISIVTSGNIVCPQDGTVTLNLRAGLTDDSLGLSGTMTPDSIEFTIPAGAYTDTTSQHSSDAVTASLTMSVDETKLPPGHEAHNLAATATYGGEAVGLCQGDIGTQESSASHQVTFPIKQVAQETAAPGAGGNNGGNGGENGGATPPAEPTDPSDDSEEGPAPGVLTLVIVALAFAAMRRRQ